MRYSTSIRQLILIIFLFGCVPAQAGMPNVADKSTKATATSTQAVPVSTKAGANSNQTPAPTSKPNLKWSKRTVNLQQYAPGFYVSITYPYFTGQPAATVKKVNYSVMQVLVKQATKARINYLEVASAESSTKKDGSGLDGSFTVHRLDDRFASVSFALSYFSYGAAHPDNFYTVFNYQLQPPRQIKLSDLSVDKKAFVAAISKQCSARLVKMLQPEPDDHSISEGAGPKSENFENFVLLKNGIGFLFSDDQVSPHARPIEAPVVVPYSSLKKYLKPTIL